ncbi:MAG: hypothetical protein U5P10_13410 [Spirochaetia bacterium]|nr:hypothetical protein [Spirochaetia bacterium]
MSKESSNAQTDSRLADVKARVGHIPLIRKNQFILSYLAFLVFFGLFLLPDIGTPAPIELALVVMYFLLVVVWAAIVLSDELKSDKQNHYSF